MPELLWTRLAVERLVGALKHDASYKLSPALTDEELLKVAWGRATRASRGLAQGVGLRACSAPLFCGRNVSLRHRRLIRLGRAVTLEDGVLIDALSAQGVEIGSSSTIGRYSEVRGSGVFARPGVGVRIGRNVGIGSHCYIGGQGGVELEDDVIIGPGVVLISEDHKFEEDDVAIRLQGEERAPIVVEKGAWLGAHCVVLKGVTIGFQSVVAAGAVVRSDVPPRTVVGGVPARVLREL